jgi:hypothetical protein
MNPALIVAPPVWAMIQQAPPPENPAFLICSVCGMSDEVARHYQDYDCEESPLGIHEFVEESA